MGSIGDIYPTTHSTDSANLEKPSASTTSSRNDDGTFLQRSETGTSSLHDAEATPVQTPGALEWDGPDDPDNPFNWSHAKRGLITLTVGLVGFTVTLGSSVYTPASSEVAQKFNVSKTAALLGLTLYTIGLGFGPVLAAPISEIYGRNVVYKTSIPVAALFTLGAGFSNNFASLLVCRFFAGFFAGPVLAVGAGTNADMWPERYATIGVTAFVLWPFAGPALGPFIGGFVAQYKGWRWTQWVILFASAGVYLMLLFVPETYKKAILKKRAKNRGLGPPKTAGPQGAAAIKFLLTVTLLRPVHMLFTEPIVTCISLYVAFAFAVLFAFFAAFPIVFGGVYG
ncbi:Major facilitator superfamily, partial [Macrophomina phaseolina MS6]